MSGIQFNLGQVPETLLLPLWGRAELTRAGSPILQDRVAAEIIDKLDYDFSKVRGDLDYSKNLSWLARARQFDDIIRAFLSRSPEATVVNLGAGLDTTSARVDNGTLRWFDLDLPEVIEVRKSLIPETSRSKCIAASLLDHEWMAQVASAPQRLLFVAGGVLFYFSESALVDLFRAMGRRFPGAEIVFDAMTPAGVKKANGMLRKVGMEGAVMRWGLTDARVLESWQANVELLDQFEYFRGLDLRGIPLKTRVMTIANRLLRVMTIVHCRWRSAPAVA